MIFKMIRRFLNCKDKNYIKRIYIEKESETRLYINH